MITETASSLTRRAWKALQLLRPFDVAAIEKMRYGRSGDGGYILSSLIVPDTPVYSFGVGDEISFEFDLAQRGCNIFLHDHTVMALPYTHPRCHFFQEGVAARVIAEQSLAPIEFYIRRHGHEGRSDLILKLDVEGSEYNVLAATADDVLQSFSQIALEIHQLHRLTDPEFSRAYSTILEKLNRSHVLFHVHANNCGPLVFVAGFPVPDVLELSYIRRDLAIPKPSATIYPTYLDCANDPERPDFPLFYFPFYPANNLDVQHLESDAIESAVASLDLNEWLHTSPELTLQERKAELFTRKLRPTASAEASLAPAGERLLKPQSNTRRLRILYFACHETLEYDDVRMFVDMGHQVFSIGGLANPGSLKPATRPTAPEFYSFDCWNAFTADPGNDLLTKRITRNFAQRFDIAIVNHDPALLDLNHDALADLPILFRSIGQSNTHIESLLRPHLGRVKVIRYSEKESGLPGFCRCDRVIYFAKFLDDYPQWEPGSRAITFHNSFPTRATVSVPSLTQYEKLATTEPADLYGFLNDGVQAWRGLAPAELQLELYRTAGLYLYVYSVPPSYTLSLIEAMLVGVPVLAPSAAAVRTTLGPIAEQCGFLAERYEVADLLDHDQMLLWDTPDEISTKARALLKSTAALAVISERLRAKAARTFDVRVISLQWQSLMLECVFR